MGAYIAIGLSFFEDVELLPKCLDSVLANQELLPYVKVLAIDGKYRGYPIDHDLSEDGSRQLVQEYQGLYGEEKIVLYDYPNLHERFKRQKYVDIAAREGIPWLLILDSDEYLQISTIDKLVQELAIIEMQWYDTNIEHPLPVQRVGNVCQVMSIDLGESNLPVHMQPRPRLWYRPEDMHYTSKHFWFARRDEVKDPNDIGNFRQDNLNAILNSKYKTLSINNMVIWHSHNGRTKDRENRREVYEFDRLPKLEGTPKQAIFDKENIKM